MKFIGKVIFLFLMLHAAGKVYSQNLKSGTSEKKQLPALLRAGQGKTSFSLELENLFLEKIEAQKNQNPLEEARINLKIGKLTWESGFMDYGVEFLEKAAEQFQKIGRNDTLPDILLLLADRYESLGEINAAIATCSRGLSALDARKASIGQKPFLKDMQSASAANEVLKRKILMRLNNFADPKGEPDRVLQINQELLEILRNSDKNSKEFSKVTNNIGHAWLNKNEPAKAEEYFRKAILLEEERNDRKNVSAQVEFKINLARALLVQNKFRDAEKELKTALGICRENRLTPLESSIHCFLSKIELNKDDLMSANRSSEYALQLARNINNAEKTQYLEQALENHALILRKSGSYSEAFNVMMELKKLKDKELKEQKNKAIKEKERKESSRELEKSFGNMQEIYLNYQNEVRALEEFKQSEKEKEKSLLHLRIQDSLKKTILQDSIKASQAEYNALAYKALLDKKEEDEQHSIELNEQKSRAKTKMDSLEKLNIEAQQKRKVSELLQINAVKERRNIQAIAIATGIFFIAASYFALDSRRKNKRLRDGQLQIEAANKALGSLNRQLTGKNKSITESIQYARGIQAAILPGEKRWKEVFSDSFVFFQPKDIVSGDFYFLTSLGNRHIIAFADCTGHGVPGALMSIIGHNLLVSAVDIHGISKPAEILRFMDQGLRNTLQQDGQENQDGMEIGICAFDLDKNILEFSGSRRPLYGLQNGDFIEWKGDRHYLGSGKTTFGDFTTYSCPLSELSEIWLSSDGYPDQFGGPELKRFHSGKLKKLLISMAGNPAEKQLDALKATFTEWRGNTPQLDDVMVIGIRPEAMYPG